MVDHPAKAMEIQYIWFSLLLTFVLLVLHIIRKSKPKKAGADLPPSPWKLPIIGHIHHLMLGGGACPHRTLRDLATKHGPVMYLKLGEIHHVVISSAEAAKEVMKTQDLNFASRPALLFTTIVVYGNTDVVFSPYSSYQRQLRQICVHELLSPGRVKAFRGVRQEAVESLVSNITESGRTPINLTESLALLTSGIVTRAAFGKECGSRQTFITKGRVALEFLAGFSVADVFPSWPFIGSLSGARRKLERIHRELDDILDEIVTDHQVQREPMSSQDTADRDLVDVLLRLKEEGGLEHPLTLTSIKAVLMDLFLAGTESPSVTLEWAMAELARQPETMKKAQAEVRRVAGTKGQVEDEDVERMDYIKLVVKEVLRLHVPGPLLLPRLCAETCEVGGYRIPKGTRVLVNAWSIARDGRYWEEPESFRPERFEGSPVDFRGGSFEFTPFGGGRRMCPGIDFALAEIELALAILLFHFDWELPDGMKPEELNMTECFRAAAVRKSALRLVATRRF